MTVYQRVRGEMRVLSSAEHGALAMIARPVEIRFAPRHTRSMHTIEIPEELVKEANRFGVDVKMLAARALLQRAEQLSQAEAIIVSDRAKRIETEVARAS